MSGIFPAGGLGPDNRLGVYFGDSWKVKRNFTLSYGVRYNRDTGATAVRRAFEKAVRVRDFVHYREATAGRVESTTPSIPSNIY